MHGPMSGRRNDPALLTESGLLAELERSAADFCIWGSGLPISVSCADGDQESFNGAMGKLRLCVKSSFGKILQYFAYLYSLLQEKAEAIAPACRQTLSCGIYLTNGHTCLYGSVTASYFDCAPPTLEEYLY